MNHSYLITTCLIIMATTGCSSLVSTDIEQTITGTFSMNQHPAIGSEFRLSSGGSSECESNYISFISDSSGKILGTRKVTIGKLAVVVQNDILCVKEGDKWQTIWKEGYGPASEKINFMCDHDIDSNWRCSMNGQKPHPLID